MKEFIQKLELLKENNDYDDVMKARIDSIITDLDGIEEHLKDVFSEIANVYNYAVKRKMKEVSTLIDKMLIEPISSLTDHHEQTSVSALKEKIKKTIE